MNRFLRLSEGDRRDAFTETANRLGLPPYVIEKDFWVCFLLDLIFNRLDVEMEFMFKGGTSLSKCYRLISRFSEDIDLSLHRDKLGFGDDNAPEAAASKTQAGKRIRELKAGGITFVREELHPALYTLLQEILEMEAPDLEISADNEEDILFHYPRSLAENNYADIGYIQPRVQIETGTKSEFQPTEPVQVRSYTAEVFGELFENPAFHVIALQPARTFWEKVTAIHALNNRNDAGKITDRISRHIYDIHAILNSRTGTSILADVELLEGVARHKALYFRDGKADYIAAAEGKLHLLPSDTMTDAYKTDYQMMNDFFFAGFEPPEFNDLLETLEYIESAVRDSVSKS